MQLQLWILLKTKGLVIMKNPNQMQTNAVQESIWSGKQQKKNRHNSFHNAHDITQL